MVRVKDDRFKKFQISFADKDKKDNQKAGSSVGLTSQALILNISFASTHSQAQYGCMNAILITLDSNMIEQHLCHFKGDSTFETVSHALIVKQIKQAKPGFGQMD